MLTSCSLLLYLWPGLLPFLSLLLFFLLVPIPENRPTWQVFFLQTVKAASYNSITETQIYPSSTLHHSCLSPAVNEMSKTEQGIGCKPRFYQDICNAELTGWNLSQSPLKIKGMKSCPLSCNLGRQWAAKRLQVTGNDCIAWVFNAMCSISLEPRTVYLLCPWCSTASPSSKTHLCYLSKGQQHSVDKVWPLLERCKKCASWWRAKYFGIRGVTHGEWTCLLALVSESYWQKPHLWHTAN